MPIIIEKQDGTVEILRFSEAFLHNQRLKDWETFVLENGEFDMRAFFVESVEDAVARLAPYEILKMKEHRTDLEGATIHIVKEADLPEASLTRQHAWRMKNGKLVDDKTIPDKSGIKEFKDRVKNAKSVDELKTLMMEMLG